MPVPGGAGWCPPLPRGAEVFCAWCAKFFACNVAIFLHICPEIQVATLYVLMVHWSCPEDADASARHCQEMPSFFTCDVLSSFACDVPSFLIIYPELTIAKLYVLAVHWSCPEDATTLRCARFGWWDLCGSNESWGSCGKMTLSFHWACWFEMALVPFMSRIWNTFQIRKV